MTYTVDVFDNERQKIASIITEPGQNLLMVLKNNQIFIDAPCGGNRHCLKCKVAAFGGITQPDEDELRFLSNEELISDIRLACFTKVVGNCSVILPKSYSSNIQSTGEIKSLEFESEYYAKMLAPLNRESLKSFAEERNLELTYFNKQLESGFVIHNFERILDVKASPYVYGFAVDIGTTTIAAYFYSLIDGKKQGIVSELNLQRSYGADVISRISYSKDEQNGLFILADTIRKQLNNMIGSFCISKGIDREDIIYGVIAGNTVMLHLLAMIDPFSISVAPYKPKSLFGNTYKPDELGIDINRSGEIYLTPCVAGYVGGDITAGLFANDCDISDETLLFIDIGTNGEMALAVEGNIVSCATAAGPAFEGAHIKFGIGGVEGAISQVTLEDNQINVKTIADKKAVGICGSGLIDIISLMLTTGIIDETGFIADKDEVREEFADRIIEVDGNNAFVVDKPSGIYISQQDIREIQLAKAAIAAGINTLLKHKNISIENVDKILVAGGFGSYINIESASNIGLLPKLPKERIKSVGNASGMGAIKALLSKTQRQRLASFASRIEYIELSGNQVFNEEYINEMSFE